MNWKQLVWVGASREPGGAFRVFYVAKFEEAIYVLHAFQKRSRRTARFDIDLGEKRYREVVSSRSR